jgi:toxin FitB
MYLLDTNVVSELRKPRPHGGVVAWVQAVPANQCFVSALTLGEIQAGIEKTREQDALKADALERWLNQLASSSQVLVLDATVMRLHAQLMHRRSDTLYEDGLIAATALVHKLTVATRNLADFKPFAVPVFNPFSGR